ncbi:MAG: PH domain-containing protein [Egibacteraceae bacterium]
MTTQVTTTDRYLADDEDIVTETRRHASVLIWPATPVVIVFLLAFLWSSLAGPGMLSAVIWWVALALLLWFAWKWAEWSLDRIVLTNRRIFVVHGVVVRKVAMMPLVKVTDLGYTRSVTGRLLGYGGVRLESAGQVQDLEHINYLPNPDDFYRTLTSLVLGGSQAF